MKRIFPTGCLVLALLPAARAQAPGAPEPLSAWPYFKELRLPRAGPGLLDFVLDRETLDQARADQADLRLGADRVLLDLHALARAKLVDDCPLW